MKYILEFCARTAGGICVWHGAQVLQSDVSGYGSKAAAVACIVVGAGAIASQIWKLR